MQALSEVIATWVCQVNNSQTFHNLKCSTFWATHRLFEQNHFFSRFWARLPPTYLCSPAFQPASGSANITLNSSRLKPRVILMQTDKRVILLVFILLVALAAGSCKPAQQNANAAKPKSGRWAAQYRSPELAKYSGTNMAVIFYSSISVVSPSVVFVAGDMPNPKLDGERVGVIVRTSDGGQSWTETTIEQQGAHVTALNSIHFINPNEGWAV